MRNKITKFGAATALIAAVLCAPVNIAVGQTAKNNATTQTAKSTTLPTLPIEQFTLPNGLRVVLSKDDALPVVSVAVYYNVGSRNEREGRSGFAHLFEHMMFQGSENVGKAEHFQYIGKNGGVDNGDTTQDRTSYYETLPANQLPLALWLESDRMRSLKITAENFENQRKVVQEEKRMRVDNQPYVGAIQSLDTMVFANFANSHTTIGSMEDLSAAKLEDVQQFFKINYAPNNAVLSIVGSFEPKEARTLIEKYFATIPRQPAPPAPNVDEPANIVTKSAKLTDKFAPLPAFVMAWKIPARGTAEQDALTLAGTLLFEGESSRLNQKLVKDEQTAVQIFGRVDDRRGPSSLWIGALPAPGKDASKMRDSILAEIKQMATAGPTAAEMEKLRNQLFNDEVRGRQSSLFRAQRIAEFALYDNDPNLINTNLDKLLAITPDQIKAATAKYLDTDNRVNLDIIPASAASTGK